VIAQEVVDYKDLKPVDLAMNPVGWASSFKIFTAHKKGYD
jgi:hypothetical protein